MPVRYETQVLESDLDSFGHMNNASYLRLFEAARWDHVTRKGYGFIKMQELRMGPIMLEVNLKFVQEVRLRERITIESQVLEYDGWAGRLQQTLLKEDGAVGAVAVFRFGLFDMNKRKIVLASDDWKRALSTED